MNPHQVCLCIRDRPILIVHKPIFGWRCLHGPTRIGFFGNADLGKVFYLFRLNRFGKTMNAEITYGADVVQLVPKRYGLVSVIISAQINSVILPLARNVGLPPKDHLAFFLERIHLPVGIFKLLEGGKVNTVIKSLLAIGNFGTHKQHEQQQEKRCF